MKIFQHIEKLSFSVNTCIIMIILLCLLFRIAPYAPYSLFMLFFFFLFNIILSLPLSTTHLDYSGLFFFLQFSSNVSFMPVVCKINGGVPTIWAQEENVSIMLYYCTYRLAMVFYFILFVRLPYTLLSLKGRMKPTPLLLSGAL